jgi:hypothetical protein
MRRAAARASRTQKSLVASPVFPGTRLPAPRLVLFMTETTLSRKQSNDAIAAPIREAGNQPDAK